MLFISRGRHYSCCVGIVGGAMSNFRPNETPIAFNWRYDMKGKLLFRVLVVATVFGSLIGTAYSQVKSDIELHLSFDALAKWDVGPGQLYAAGIPVCWENPSDDSRPQMKLVKDAVAASWQKYSALNFTGWQKCAAANAGIRILIEDSGPHTKGLGNRLDKKINGMVLNFTFANWSEACRQSEETRSFCIRSIAVHEFGHALGFAHEQNRADAPGECQELRQGSDGPLLLTPYDPKSVMNYCNGSSYSNGVLSELDIVGVQKVYGRPKTPVSNSNKFINKF